MITRESISNTVVNLLRLSSFQVRPEVKEALKEALRREEELIPKMQLETILKNIALAEARNIPVCQDTGIPFFYVTMGDLEVEDVEAGIRDGVGAATKSLPLRPNAVHPLSRNNPGNNVGERIPYIHYRFSKRDYLEITVIAKGAGSENMSALAMLPPSQGITGVKQFILETVVQAGGRPCPPTILGIGLGGSADVAVELSKEALLRPINVRNQNPEVARLELELLEGINELGIGPMGLGGRTTTLGVNIEYAYCHTASLPVAISFQCWADRVATARMYADRSVEYCIGGGHE